MCQRHNKLDTAMRMDFVQLCEFWASNTTQISFNFQVPVDSLVSLAQRCFHSDAGNGDASGGKNNNSSKSSNLHLLNAYCVPGTNHILCIRDLAESSSPHSHVGIIPVFIY